MRTLIVTGATGGLGAEVVRHLAREYSLVALVRSMDSLGALREVAGDAVRAVQADLADPDSVRRAVGSAGKPYGLVHLAGGYAGGSIAETTDETWQQMIGINLTSAFVAIRETLAVMDRTAPGRIIVISSEAALSKSPGNLAYTVSKSALNVLVELVAKELRATPVTINALLPSSLDTPAMRAVMPRNQLVPLERIAASLLFFLGEGGASVSGALVPLTAR